MHRLFITLVVAALASLPTGCAAPPPASASPEQAAVMATVQQFVGGFNMGDAAMATAACASEMSIIDEFPPYEWHGAGALSRWLADYDANAQRHGISAGLVVIDETRHIDIAGDAAYVVAVADYAFQQKGEPVFETGSLFTFALAKGASGWRITGWVWSKN